MKLQSVQRFTIYFVSIYCFQGVISLDLREDAVPSSAPFNPSFTSRPLNPASSVSPFYPSSTVNPYLRSSTYMSFMPSSTFSPFNPSDISSSSQNVAQFLLQQTTTAPSILTATTNGETLEELEGRRFLTPTDLIPTAISNIPLLLTNHIQATRHLVVNTLAVAAYTFDLLISSIQMGKSNVATDLINIGKNFLDLKESYNAFSALISDDLMAVTTIVRKIPGVELLRFIVEGPLGILQGFKNFMMSLIKPDDPDFQI